MLRFSTIPTLRNSRLTKLESLNRLYPRGPGLETYRERTLPSSSAKEALALILISRYIKRSQLSLHILPQKAYVSPVMRFREQQLVKGRRGGGYSKVGRIGWAAAVEIVSSPASLELKICWDSHLQATCFTGVEAKFERSSLP